MCCCRSRLICGHHWLTGWQGMAFHSPPARAPGAKLEAAALLKRRNGTVDSGGSCQSMHTSNRRHGTAHPLIDWPGKGAEPTGCRDTRPQVRSARTSSVLQVASNGSSAPLQKLIAPSCSYSILRIHQSTRNILVFFGRRPHQTGHLWGEYSNTGTRYGAALLFLLFCSPPSRLPIALSFPLPTTPFVGCISPPFLAFSCFPGPHLQPRIEPRLSPCSFPARHSTRTGALWSVNSLRHPGIRSFEKGCLDPCVRHNLYIRSPPRLLPFFFLSKDLLFASPPQTRPSTRGARLLLSALRRAMTQA